MSQRLLAERQNSPRGDYVAQTINPCVLGECVLAQGAVSHGGVTPGKHKPGPHSVTAVSSDFWAVRLSKTGSMGRRGKRVPFTFKP